MTQLPDFEPPAGWGRPCFPPPTGQPWGPPPVPPPASRRAPLVGALLSLVSVLGVGFVALVMVTTFLDARSPAPATSSESVVTPSSRAPHTPAPSEPQPGFPAPDVNSAPNPGYYDAPLAENPLYDVVPPDLDCGPVVSYPTWQGMVESWQADLACLDAAWQPVVKDPAGGPQLRFFDDEVETTCGRSDWSAFYCSGDSTIYVGRKQFEQQLGWATDHWDTIVHEYFHYLQHRAGMLPVRTGMEDRLVVSRRTELQAVCFATLQERHLGFTAEQFDEVRRDSLGDEVHGSTEVINDWQLVGWHGATVGSCNTWVVDAQEVRYP